MAQQVNFHEEDGLATILAYCVSLAIIPKSRADWARVFTALAVSSVVASFVSIAAYQILLGASLAVLLCARDSFRAPPAWPAALLFFVFTLASLAASPDPAAGLPQIRKFYVWLALVTVASAIRETSVARNMLLASAAAATASAAWSLVQFAVKFERARSAGQNFYLAYVADRITGFMSHWMTFSGQMMVAFLILASWILFGEPKKRMVALAAAALIGVALVLSFSRGNWAAAALGAAILLWLWRSWAVLILPVALAAVFVAAPAPVQERVRSVWNPTERDSNLHRAALREAGLAMIAENPLLGVGPEQVKLRFPEYVPERFKPIREDWWYNHLHNVYIHYAAERGLPAAIALVLFAGWVLKDFRKAWKNQPPGRSDRRFLLAAALTSIVAILTGGFWEVNLGDSEILMLFVSIVSVGYAAERS
jgi:O-antigen ligase